MDSPMNRRVDWSEIKAAYIEGVEADGARSWPVIAAVSERFGTPLSTVKKKAMQEKWVERRNLFRTKVELARQEKKVHAEAVKAADFDVSAIRAAALLLAQIEAHLHNTNESDTDLSIASLKTLAVALFTVFKTARLAFGDDIDKSIQRDSVNAAGAKPDLSSLSIDELHCLERAQHITNSLRAKVKPSEGS